MNLGNGDAGGRRYLQLDLEATGEIRSDVSAKCRVVCGFPFSSSLPFLPSLQQCSWKAERDNKCHHRHKRKEVNYGSPFFSWRNIHQCCFS